MSIAATNKGVKELLSDLEILDRRYRFMPIEAGHLSLRDGDLQVAGEVVRLSSTPPPKHEKSESEFRFARIGQLCDSLGIPSGYIPGLPDPLCTDIINYELAQPKRPQSLVVMGRDFVRFDRSDLVRISASEVVAAALEVLPTELSVNTLELNQDSLRLELVSPSAKGEPRPGDHVSGGVRIDHSLTAAHPTTVLCFLLRIVCMNGQTSRSCGTVRSVPRVRRLPIEIDDAKHLMIKQVKRVTWEAFEDVAEKLEGLHALAHEKLRDQSDVERVWTQHLRRVRVDTKEIFDQLRAAWHEEQDLTVYGALNAITRVATHNSSQLKERWKRDRLSSLAGVLSSSTTHLCPKCYSVVLGSASA